MKNFIYTKSDGIQQTSKRYYNEMIQEIDALKNYLDVINPNYLILNEGDNPYYSTTELQEQGIMISDVYINSNNLKTHQGLINNSDKIWKLKTNLNEDLIIPKNYLIIKLNNKNDKASYLIYPSYPPATFYLLNSSLLPSNSNDMAWSYRSRISQYTSNYYLFNFQPHFNKAFFQPFKNFKDFPGSLSLRSYSVDSDNKIQGNIVFDSGYIWLHDLYLQHDCFWKKDTNIEYDPGELLIMDDISWSDDSIIDNYHIPTYNIFIKEDGKCVNNMQIRIY